MFKFYILEMFQNDWIDLNDINKWIDQINNQWFFWSDDGQLIVNVGWPCKKIQISQIGSNWLSVLVKSSGECDSFGIKIDFYIDGITQMELPALE